jgi:hypothetical protein
MRTVTTITGILLIIAGISLACMITEKSDLASDVKHAFYSFIFLTPGFFLLQYNHNKTKKNEKKNQQFKDITFTRSDAPGFTFTGTKSISSN